ncbi:MAG: TolC family protein [Acidobacteria bacterium]|nr:TolC family protein [Acidobacteriota bacterium]
MSRLMFVVSFLCACVPATAAQAPPSAAPASLTIAQAVDEALQHNLSLLAERSNLTIADAAMITARLRPNPVLSFSVDHLDALGTGFDASNNGGPPEIAWRVDVPLERGGKREARMALASVVKSAADAHFADAIRTLRQDVTMACVDVIAADATRTLLADTLRTFEDLARVNRARVAAGSIAPFESTRSEVAMLQFRATVVRVDLDLASATARLRTLLGRPPGAPLAITDRLSTDRTEPAPDPTRLEAVAFDARPDLKAMQFAQARSTADLRLQEALGRIDYTLGAEYRRQQGIAGRSNSLGFFFSTPLPLSSRNQGDIARAGAERDLAERQITARRAQIAAEVRSAYHEYVTTRDLVGSIERDLLTPATHARETSAYTYRAGGATLLELLDAQRAFNDTMQSYVDAQASLRRSVTRLNAAVGTEVVP